MAEGILDRVYTGRNGILYRVDTTGGGYLRDREPYFATYVRDEQTEPELHLIENDDYAPYVQSGKHGRWRAIPLPQKNPDMMLAEATTLLEHVNHDLRVARMHGLITIVCQPCRITLATQGGV